MSRRLALALLCAAAVLLAASCKRDTDYSGVGDVVEVDLGTGHLRIRHPGVDGLAEAGVSIFTIGDVATGDLRPGTRVRFEARRRGDALLLVGLIPIAAQGSGFHDHTPHHGGVVAMVGSIHLEAVARPEGEVVLFLTDLLRRPLPLEGVQATAALRTPEGESSQTLTPAGEAMTGRFPVFAGAEVHVKFTIVRDGESSEMTFALPLDNRSLGAAGVPAEGCIAQEPGPPDQPRCTMQIARPITALASTPDGATALVAAVDVGVTTWSLPAGKLIGAFAAPPPIPMPADEPPHPESINALRVDPSGQHAVVALETRLLRYDIASGALQASIDGPGGVVRDVAWSPNGADFLVSTFYAPQAALLSAVDGKELRRFPAEREAAAVVFDPATSNAVVGGEMGTIAIFTAESEKARQILRPSASAVRALAFASRRLWSASEDGIVRAWNLENGRILAQWNTGGGAPLAADRGGQHVAAAGPDGAILLFDADKPAPGPELRWHSSPVVALTWAGSRLISGDARGYVAVWEPFAPAP